MNSEAKSLKRSEAATLKLRNLYESYGYRKYRMGQFEEYSLYAENKSFLPSENVLTFTDLDGRLMALKPDITLGIAKNVKAGKGSCEKVYYIENVYRECKESHTYKEISQMGLECMGAVDLFTVIEVLTLAVKTLASFGVDYVLKLSSMDFIVGLMEELKVTPRMKERLLSRIRKKNTSELAALCSKAGFGKRETEKVLLLPQLYGDFPETLEKASSIAETPAMREALRQMKLIYSVLESRGLAKKLRLDFSMINDIEYYNGVIFQGYLEGLARHVLSGGQYDGMMVRLKKAANAIGFALYLKEVDWLPQPPASYDADALILYEEDVDFRRLFEAADRLRREGLQVRTERSVPRELRFRYIYRYHNGLELLQEDLKRPDLGVNRAERGSGAC